MKSRSLRRAFRPKLKLTTLQVALTKMTGTLHIYFNFYHGIVYLVDHCDCGWTLTSRLAQWTSALFRSPLADDREITKDEPAG
jgi:hypothetical protein